MPGLNHSSRKALPRTPEGGPRLPVRSKINGKPADQKERSYIQLTADLPKVGKIGNRVPHDLHDYTPIFGRQMGEPG
jgi:hypothetical protein